MRMGKLLVTLLWSLTLAAAMSPVRSDERKLVITGSSTIAPLVSEIAKRFEEKQPGTRIDVQSGGSSRGINDVRSGLANIGMVSRSPKAEEADLKAFAIARDGVGIILNSANAITSLTNEQIVDIYTGRATDWNQVGGKAGPITVVNKAEGRSTLELFLHYFKLKASDIKAQVVIGDNQQGLKTIAGNPGAIGYVSIGTAEYEASNGTPIKLLAVKGVEASVKNVENGTFPIARPLNLVTREEPQGLARAFIDFARSASVHYVVKEQYFVPISP